MVVTYKSPILHKKEKREHSMNWCKKKKKKRKKEKGKRKLLITNAKKAIHTIH